MATFPAIKPTYSFTKQSEPKLRTTQFGDGYAQRLPFGLNQNPKSWDLQFNVTDTNADTIESFLDARAADGASFDWTPPNSATSYKWFCTKWQRVFIGPRRSEISCTFNQVFEP